MRDRFHNFETPAGVLTHLYTTVASSQDGKPKTYLIFLEHIAIRKLVMKSNQWPISK